MNALLAVARQLQDFCEARAWHFCFIGGIAVQRWAEPRVTDDVDLTLLTGFGDEERFVDDLLTWLRPREPDGREFALRHRVLLAQSPEGIPLDIALGALPFEAAAVRRARDEELLPGLRLRVCTAEDLIVFKAFAGRALDWRDVEMTIARQGESALDWSYIEESLRPLVELKETPETLAQLEALRRSMRGV
jgi:hypothetical protein